MLGQLAPLILKHQATGSIGAVVLNPGQLSQSLSVGNYTITVSRVRDRRSMAVASTTADAAPAYAMVIGTGPDDYVIAGGNAEITFSPNTPGPQVAGLAQVQAGHFVNGTWVPGRWLNGDDVLLNYKLAEAAATNQSGSGLRFGTDGPTIQSVKLYRYQ